MEQQKNRPIRTGVKITCPVCGKADVSIRWGQHTGKAKAGPGPGPMTTIRHSDPRGRRCFGPDDAMDAMLESSGLWVAFESPACVDWVEPSEGSAWKQEEPQPPKPGGLWKTGEQRRMYEQAQDEGRLF